MWLDCSTKQLGSVECDQLLSNVRTMGPEVWERDTFRQAMKSAQTSSKSVVFYFQDHRARGYHPNKTRWCNEENRDFWPALKDIFEGVERRFDGKIVRALLANLPAGAKVPPHTDGRQPHFIYSHRLHLPLITHDDVVFTVQGERVVLEEGKLYEINNIAKHSVENKSNTDRIHLIMDVVEKKDFCKFDRASNWFRWSSRRLGDSVLRRLGR